MKRTFHWNASLDGEATCADEMPSHVISPGVYHYAVTVTTSYENGDDDVSVVYCTVGHPGCPDDGVELNLPLTVEANLPGADPESPFEDGVAGLDQYYVFYVSSFGGIVTVLGPTIDDCN